MNGYILYYLRDMHLLMFSATYMKQTEPTSLVGAIDLQSVSISYLIEIIPYGVLSCWSFVWYNVQVWQMIVLVKSREYGMDAHCNFSSLHKVLR